MTPPRPQSWPVRPTGVRTATPAGIAGVAGSAQPHRSGEPDPWFALRHRDSLNRFSRRYSLPTMRTSPTGAGSMEPWNWLLHGWRFMGHAGSPLTVRPPPRLSPATMQSEFHTTSTPSLRFRAFQPATTVPMHGPRTSKRLLVPTLNSAHPLAARRTGQGRVPSWWGRADPCRTNGAACTRAVRTCCGRMQGHLLKRSRLMRVTTQGRARFERRCRGPASSSMAAGARLRG